MRKLLLIVGCIVMATSTTMAQKSISQYQNGWPSREGKIDIRKGFVNPPSGYGNVPFYWWSGDSLNIDRLTEQLEILADASTSGLNVSYNHTNADIDTVLNAQGHGNCGRVQGGAPRVMSDEWWEIWNKFSGRCADRGIGLGMDDYVIAWPKNGEFIDTVLALPEIRQYQGHLEMKTLAANDPRPENVITEMRKPESDSLWVVYSTPSPELNPLLGQKIVEYYFQPFEDHMDKHGREGMNYFFQDELQYYPDLYSWSEDMKEEFHRRKGYDITPMLPALFVDMGPETYRWRLDYAQVVTELSHERYFKPIYDWHISRGLIYGSDNEGRGLDPVQYLDYFQAEQWFTAPGNDAPARGSSFNQTKVSSSIAHLYKRPRTWLEAFHSMGWDANGALLTHQLDHHIIAGGNLLCMHGLYYSTHGGWWEWAPPSFHFRMPYWPHMKVWLRYAERLCFLLSQGVHVADVAILYPTETMQAVPGTEFDSTRDAGQYLSEHGCDYDYINYTHLQQATIKDGALCVSDEKYRVLVLVDTQAMHEETWRQIEAFAKSGGLVIVAGNTMQRLAQLADATHVKTAEEVLNTIRQHVPADFKSQSGEGRVLHRRIGQNDVYMVMDVEEGEELYFRSKGRLEVWDAQHGTMQDIAALRQTEQGTWVCSEAGKDVSRLYVFSTDEQPTVTSTTEKATATLHEMPIEGEWSMEIVPTLDNKWGDFRLPAKPGYIGVESRSMQSAFLPDGSSDVNSWSALEATTLSENQVYGYGPLMQLSVNEGDWEDYYFSWQYGVFDNPGGQGYHGLKAKVDPRFLILDKAGQMAFRTRVYVPQTGAYRFDVEGVRPDEVLLDGYKTPLEPLTLEQGWHQMQLTYRDTKDGHCSLEDLRYETDKRARSMVVLYPQDAPAPKPYDEYAPIVASQWYGTNQLVYDPRGGETGAWLYKFQTAPGTRSMQFDVRGEILRVWADGEAQKVRRDGSVRLKKFNPHAGTAYVLVRPEAGYAGATCFSEPVGLTCKGGTCQVGDWTKLGAMHYYSGGVRYAKDVRIDKLPEGPVSIDLGDVDATCEVAINGQHVDVLINKPYQLDITPYLRRGKNHIEVLVYSSLSSHYQTIPSPYKGTPHAGLLGPVRLMW